MTLFLDLVFPPLCLECLEWCATKYLCPSCWALCSPPDPVDCCRHCFEPVESEHGLCMQCRKAPLLPAVRAFVFDREAPMWRLRDEPKEGLAGFAVYQWIALDWPDPDAVISMDDTDSKKVARFFAKYLEWPYKRKVEEDHTYLLIDAGNPIELVRKKLSQLAEFFPKRIFVLSLFH